MTAYRYEALDASGGAAGGVIEADNARLARSKLRDQGLFPTVVAAVSAMHSDARQAMAVRADLAALVMVTREWATLLEAGLTIEQSLNALIEQGADANLSSVFAGVRAEALAGHSLGTALGRFTTVFPEVYRAVIEAGEKSGRLSQLLDHLAGYLESTLAARRKLLQAALYPLILVAVSLAVIVGLMTFVVPQIVSVFSQSHQALPWLTRALIFTSDVVRLAGIPAVLLIVAVVVAVRRLLRDPALKQRWHAKLLKVAVFGNFIRVRESVRFAGTLSILVRSGVPLLNALQGSRDVVGNLHMRQLINEVVDSVKQGKPLNRAMAESRIFSPLLVHLVAAGEASGALDQMLARAASQQQAELDQKTGLLLTVLEPALILFMGLLVMGIVLAILLPIVEVNLLLK